MNERESKLCDACESRSDNPCGRIYATQFSRLTAITDRLRLQHGATLISEGEPATHFYSITNGKALLFKLMRDGRRQVTGFAREGDFLGLAAGDRYAFGAEAIGAVAVCRHSRSKMLALLNEAPETASILQTLASRELVLAHEQMLLLGRKTARERVASFLMGEVARSPAARLDGLVLELPMTRVDIADYLGLTHETVCRAFSRLKKEAVISSILPHSVSVLDIDRLRAAADGVQDEAWWPSPAIGRRDGAVERAASEHTAVIAPWLARTGDRRGARPFLSPARTQRS